MDFDKLDPDFFARVGAYTPHIHRDIYSSIDPKSAALSQKGKVVIITGAAGGIGKGIANAFAQAGARALVLVGRQPAKLSEAARSLQDAYPSLETSVVPTDIANPSSVDSLFKSVRSSYGSANVLVNSAGIVSIPTPIASTSTDAWWQDFEINTKGTYLMTKAFLQLVGSKNPAVIVNVSSGAATNIVPGMSSYSISKTAVNRLTEYTAAENGNVVCITLDPGTVNTDMVLDSFRKFALDTPELVGGFTVWLSTEQASFLNGRVATANWFVDDLLKKKEHIQNSADLKMMLQGEFGLDKLT